MRSSGLPDLGDALEGVLPDLPGALVTHPAREALRRLARSVPHLTRQFGFECRLDPDDEVVDFGMAVSASDGGREALAGRTDDPRLGALTGQEACWRRLRDFALRWSDPDAPLHVWSPFLGLEFDAAAVSQTVPVPSVFVALDAPLDEAAGGRPQLAAAVEAADLLRGGLSHALEAALESCFEGLPTGARVLHVGAMLGRAQEGLRVSAVLPAPELKGYLSGVGGEAALEAAQVALAALPHRFPTVQVDFDLLPAVSPRVGLGLRPARTEPADWEALFAELVALGCASEAKANALVGWIGVGPARRTGANGGWETYRRDLSHVKLVCVPGRAPAAKAYFGVTLAPALFQGQ
jgi:hypothetical protein